MGHMARPRSFDEDTVLTAVRDQFWKAGYAGTTVQDLTEATGLGKGSLYGAFGDKHALFTRVFDGYCTGRIDDLREELGGDDAGALDRLTAYVLRLARASADDPRGCMLGKSTAELCSQDAAVAETALGTFDALEGLIAHTLVAAQRHGDLAPAADPQALAGLLFSMLRGMESLGKAGRSEASLVAIAETALAALPRTAPAPAARA